MTKITVYRAKEIISVVQLFEGLLGVDSYMRSIQDQLSLLADRLDSGFKNQHPGAFFELSNWHPELVGKPMPTVWAAKLDSLDFLLAVSREMGFKDWEDALTAESRPNEEFESLVDAALDGDLESVERTLQLNPSLITKRSHWKHRSTALHYMAANGVETYRQRVPSNAVEIIESLLRFGAEVNANAEMYGGNQRVLGLLKTSSHPAEAGLTAAMERVLFKVGAN